MCVWAVGAEQQQPIPRDQVRQPPEREQNSIEVGVDVGVIELDVPDHGNIGQIFEEFSGLIEEGAVVLVTLDHKVPASPHSIARAVLAEVERDSANEQRRIEPAAREQPCGQRCRGGFAVRAGEHDRARTPEKVVANGLWQRAIAGFSFQHCFELGVAPRNRIPHYDDVDVRCDVLCRVAAERSDSLFDQKIAHRRIYVLVGTLNVMSAALQQRRQCGHRGATDADQMDLPGVTQRVRPR
jgi:hypothetical protein